MLTTAHELLVRKVSSIAALSEAERGVIAELPIQLRDVPRRKDIVTEGETPSHCCLLVSGFLIRYKIMPGGQRQIVNLHVPGDIPDLQSLHLTVMDHHLASLTSANVGMIPHAAIRDMNDRFPVVASALWRVTLIDSAILRERVVSLGQRSASERLAHFLCELFVRLRAVGQTDEKTMLLQMTQPEMADALGLSTVHMNRTLQDLRARGLVVTDGGSKFLLPNRDKLASFAGFNPLYLHLARDDRPKTP